MLPFSSYAVFSQMEPGMERETSIDLVVEVEEPKGSAEELSKVKDVLGSFQTSFKTSGASRSANVRNGASLINGTTLYPGEEFSTYEAVAPFSEANGYYMAGSYLNGQGGRQSWRWYLSGIYDPL